MKRIVMKRTVLMLSCYLAALSVVLLACCQGARAEPELPLFVQQADAICVGTVKDVQVQGQASVMIGRRNGQPVMVPTDAEVATVAVEDVLKGDLTPTVIKIAFNKNAHTEYNSTRFTQLATGERAVLFLTATPDKSLFTLTQPRGDESCKVLIGGARLPPHSTTPLRSTLLTLAQALSMQALSTQPLSPSTKAVRIGCLERLGSAGFLLYVSPDNSDDRFGVKARQAFGEPLSVGTASASSLEQFIKTKILPAVLQLTSDADVDVRDQAVLAAGRLQDVDVIPALAKIAGKSYKPGMLGETAVILRFFRNPAATRPLAGVLSDSNPDVRSQAAAGLRDLADPLAVPSLLEHLDDPSADAKYYIVTALYTATDTPSYPGTVLFHDDEDKYVSFWKKWALDHQDKVAALREQFLAPLPTKAAH